MTPSHAVLIVDDEAQVADALALALAEHGFLCVQAHSLDEARQRLTERDYAAVVADVALGDGRGTELLGALGRDVPFCPVVLISGQTDVDSVIEALRLGAADFLRKPVGADDLADALRRAMERAERMRGTDAYRQRLEEAVRTAGQELLGKNRQIRTHVISTIQALVNTLEAKDKYTEGHSWKVDIYASLIGRALGLPWQQMDELSTAAVLHDIGKIGVREVVLNKPGRLTAEERAHVERHTTVGDWILEPMEGFEQVRKGVRHHHERLDGGGYPDGLAGDQISILTRVLSVADFYDAVTSDRPYRQGFSHEQACTMVEENSGQVFDPDVAAAFLKVIDSFELPDRPRLPSSD